MNEHVDADLIAFNAAEKVDIEVAGSPDRSRQTVWVVVDKGHVYVRSVSGSGALWYRTLIAIPDCTLFVDGRRVAARAVPVGDEAILQRVSGRFLEKYSATPTDAAWMASPLIALTTLRLDKQSDDAGSGDSSHHAAA